MACAETQIRNGPPAQPHSGVFRVSASDCLSDQASLDSRFKPLMTPAYRVFIFVLPIVPSADTIRHRSAAFPHGARSALEAWHIEYNNAEQALAQEPEGARREVV